MRRIVLAAVNARYSHTSISIRYLRNSISDLDYRVTVMEFTVNQGPGEIAASIAARSPDAVALSVYIWNAALVAAVVPLLRRELPSCVIVLGGPEVSYSHDLWLAEHPAIDYIVRGPGEAAFRALAEAGMSGQGPVIEHVNPHFDSIPLPYLDDDFADLKNRTVYYESSRGCPFRCSYCLSSRSDQALEFRSVQRVKDELGFIMGHCPGYIKFVDRTFNADRARARELWAHIIDRYGGAGTFFHFEVNPALLGDDDFALLGDCPRGLFQFELGIQSTNDTALKAVNRNGGFAGIRDSIQRLVGMKSIHTHVDLIAGLPHEDEESLRRSFNDIYSLGAHHFQPGLLKILNGTAMKEIADETGYEYSYLSPYQVRATPWLSALSIERYESVAFLVERLYNGGSFPLTMSALTGLFASPYDCFLDMQAFYRDRESRPLDRGRESCAGFLFRYAHSGGVRESDYIIDCLRWDWCVFSKNRHYALVLRSDSTRRTAKRFMGSENLFINEGGPAAPPLSADEVKRAIVFYPETERFRQERMQGRCLAVFVFGRPGPVFFDA